MVWRCILIGLLATGTAAGAGCDAGDDDADVADAVDDTDRAGDGNWEDGDALEIRDHAD
ncbi:MAG: hypothetical protein JXB32_04160 [Deltaproteobacteria bacterium]|nr:hypothetical protein [Deltaproteobacteria bacterium]